MDELTKELQSFLVRLHYQPEGIFHQMEHYLEHLVCLLPPEDEKALLDYFGILGHEQRSLDELAHERSIPPEVMIEHIDSSLRRLAITPEWQMMKSIKKEQ